MKIARIVLKILLCISLLIMAGLVLNYVRNLSPTTDGFIVTNAIARLIHGDDYWTWGKLTTGIHAATGIFAVLFCADKALDIISIKKK